MDGNLGNAGKAFGGDRTLDLTPPLLPLLRVFGGDGTIRKSFLPRMGEERVEVRGQQRRQMDAGINGIETPNRTRTRNRNRFISSRLGLRLGLRLREIIRKVSHKESVARP